MPFESIGVITMKMINNTSITSTIGVTLMSATGGGTGCFFIGKSPSFSGRETSPAARLASRIQLATAILRTLLLCQPLRPLEEVVDQLRAGIPHLHVERFQLPGEIIVHPDGRDSHEQTDGGGHQRFR